LFVRYSPSFFFVSTLLSLLNNSSLLLSDELPQQSSWSDTFSSAKNFAYDHRWYIAAGLSVVALVSAALAVYSYFSAPAIIVSKSIFEKSMALLTNPNDIVCQ
jgi:hypothetical protein